MNFALNRFITDASVLSEESMHNFASRIQQRRPKLLFGLAYSLFHFARFVQEKALSDIKFQAVFSTAEVLYPHQRKLIEEVFDCRVFNLYGTTETGGVACECEAHTALHISMENCLVEILKSDRPALPGELGEVVITNLNNCEFPFIRYRLGDIARLSDLQSCSCQRQHPTLEMIEGRQVDIFKTKDGRTVRGDFYSPMFEAEGIKQYQIIQKSLDLVLIRLVTGDAFQQSQLDVIERTVKQVMGPETEVKFEFVDSIAPSRSGKFRYTISEILKTDQYTMRTH
jgi:phenylacetate-CoA ligase